MIRTHPAIVLRPTPFQEGGLIVSFLTEHGERLVGLAKGAKKPSAKWVSSFEPLSLVTVSFFGKEHLESNLVVACLADLFDRLAKEGMEDDRLFRLLSACARALKQTPERAMAILAYAEHWLLHCLGLLPHPRLCGRCGREDTPLVLFTEDHGWCCSACTPVDAREALPPGAKEHLRLLRTLPVDEAPEPEATDAARVITLLLRERLLRELGGVRSYDVLNRMMV
jgi:recombinational DNA repair protein (RecF pathway)